MIFCTGGQRHWFTYYGKPGSSAPECQRYGCHAKNPIYKREFDPYALPAPEKARPLDLARRRS